MSIDEIKGTLYDLLGYFAPGLVACIGTAITVLRFRDTENVWIELRAMIRDLSILEAFIMIVAAYTLGHAIASASSGLIEKLLMGAFKTIWNPTDAKNMFGDVNYNVFCRRYASIFQAPYNSASTRSVICYVQAKQPAVYETALIFLSFYGMARNLSLVTFVFFVAEGALFILQRGNLLVLLLLLVLALIFLYEYIRFRKYYWDTILNGFLIPTNEKEDINL